MVRGDFGGDTEPEGSGTSSIFTDVRYGSDEEELSRSKPTLKSGYILANDWLVSRIVWRAYSSMTFIFEVMR